MAEIPASNVGNERTLPLSVFPTLPKLYGVFNALPRSESAQAMQTSNSGLIPNFFPTSIQIPYDSHKSYKDKRCHILSSFFEPFSSIKVFEYPALDTLQPLKGTGRDTPSPAPLYVVG